MMRIVPVTFLRVAIATCVICAALLFGRAPVSARDSGTVTFHLPFDDFGFLDDDYIHACGKQAVENRELSIVGGRFGSALRHGAIRGDDDTVSTSGNDLDLVTAVMIDSFFAEFKNIRFKEPLFFGTARLHPALGALSFWVKSPLRPGTLFEQASISWGRTEKELIDISLRRDGSLEAYVEDARYVRHVIRSAPVWKSDGWNHVVFMWDRSSGLELWHNGRKVASSMGTDAWWANQSVGLFHCAMPFADYDELYCFSRSLTESEIGRLYSINEPPVSRQWKTALDPSAVRRLKSAFSSDVSALPEAKPESGNALVFRDLTPEHVHDDGVQGWWVADGRYECAWPHEYTIFTVIPGDVDFHAERVDILPGAGVDVNYVTFEGNLDGVRLFSGDRAGNFDDTPTLDVPNGDGGFFYGSKVDGLGDGELRIPFTKEYGVPGYFESDVLRLPLSGDLRLHEVGVFNVSTGPVPPEPGDMRLFLSAAPPELNGPRCPRALSALFSARDKATLGLAPSAPSASGDSIELEPMRTYSLFCEPSAGKHGIEGVSFDMRISSPTEDNVLLVRLRNPAVPSQIWTHAEVRLRGFAHGPERLGLALFFDPVFLVSGDRLWIELVAFDGLSISGGEKNPPPTVTLKTVENTPAAVSAFSAKTMKPNILNWGRTFEFIPWDYGLPRPDVDTPEHFGGVFDTTYPWQAVLKVDPGDRVANIYKTFGTGEYVRGRHPADLSSVRPKTFDAPENAPDWAVYFRAFQTFRQRIITWWRHHQRSDGQVGGGWNDDTLIFGWRYGYGDMPLDSDPGALILFNTVCDGFDRTNYFKDGYCRVRPIDQLHNGDFVRNRCKSLIYNLGDPRSAVWAMEEAWHWGKPEKTPYNYGDGSAFLFGKNVLEWYWNRRRVDEPYRLKDSGALVSQLRTAASVHNDTTFWRYTEAWCHTDDQFPLGGSIMFDVVNGGLGEIFTRYSQNPRQDDTMAVFTVGVGWIRGGGPDLARLVDYSGNDGLGIFLYSFDSFEREVSARMLRLDPGEYAVMLRADVDGDGDYETAVHERSVAIRRFDRLDFTVPPKVPVHLDIRRIKAFPLPGDLPDLAVSDYFVVREGNDITVTVHNIGTAPSGTFNAALVDGRGNIVSSRVMESIPGSEDFVPKPITVRFEGFGKRDDVKVVLDPDNRVEEIYEGNNEAR